jgi:hypothetical protein
VNDPTIRVQVRDNNGKALVEYWPRHGMGRIREVLPRNYWEKQTECLVHYQGEWISVLEPAEVLAGRLRMEGQDQRRVSA